MTVDLLHNKIVSGTITENFKISISENLIPKLYTLYGTSLEGIQMYEDYIKDEFIKDGYMYYPMTVILGGVNATVWIKWDISDKKLFADGIPYSYLGSDNIDFSVAEDVPLVFKNAIIERSNYFAGNAVKTEVSTDAPGATVLAGRYSQTFVDEMARQLTNEIAKTCGVIGLPESSIEINMIFALNTYMEHTSENVTYRRLLISAKGCAPRDFWIKWTRLDSSSAFSVTDHVNSDNIRFEIGEDVSHKIREKEYRFLVYGNSDKYRVAMGRKNITEWRELVKRSIKRGELEKTSAELEINAHVSEVSDKLSEILEKCGVTVPAVADTSVPTDADIANEALRMAVLGAEAAVNEEKVEIADEPVSMIDSDDEFDFDTDHEQFEFTLPEETEILSDTELPSLEELLGEDVLADDENSIDADNDFSSEESESEHFDIEKEDSEEVFESENEENSEETEAEEFIDDISAGDDSSYQEDEEDSDEDNYEETENEDESYNNLEELLRAREDIERLTAEAASLRRLVESERMAKENAEKFLNAERFNASDLRAQIEKQKVAIDEIKILLEKETDAKNLAEAEAARLRAENENTLRENARLVDAVGIAESACREAELKSIENEQKLLSQIELYEKQKVREKLLVAEAARQAREEIERELASAKAENIYTESSPSWQNSSASMQENVINAQEEEKLRLEIEAARRASAKERAEELRRKMEDEARREADIKLGDIEETVCDEAVVTEPAEQSYEEPYENIDYDSEKEAETLHAPESYEPINEPAVPLNKYKYVSKIVRIMFKGTIDQSMKLKIREMMSEALEGFGKSNLYMKVKANVQDSNTVVLNFVEYPEEEMQLLIDIIHYLGNGDIGIYKVILE